MSLLRLAAALTALMAVRILFSPALADEAQLKRGETLLTRDCARCHAVGRSGTSARADAPFFRSLGTRYPIESLEEALGEGIITGHPDMPEFDYEMAEVSAIIAYLKSIQTR